MDNAPVALKLAPEADIVTEVGPLASLEIAPMVLALHMHCCRRMIDMVLPDKCLCVKGAQDRTVSVV
jgi:hypothetical protein